MSLFRALVVVGLGAMLYACGGGGGGEASIALSYSTDVVRVTAFERQAAGTNAAANATTVLTISLAVPPEGNAYVAIQDSSGAFEVIETAPLVGTSLQVTLRPRVALSAGSYSGELKVLLCKDMACSSHHSTSNDRLPYAVTITPQLRAEVLHNGGVRFEVTSDIGDNAVSVETLASDATVEFDASIPVSLSYDSGPGLPEVVVDPSSTGTYWKLYLYKPVEAASATLQVRLAANDVSKNSQWGASYEVVFADPFSN